MCAGMTLSRRESIAALAERERQLRFITDHAPVRILQCDAGLRYKFVNRPYAARFGLAPEAVVGRRIIEVVGEKVFAAVRPQIESVLRGERLEFEALIPFKDTGPRWVHSVYVPELDQGGAVIGFVATVQDVTDRRRTEEALRESEARYRAIVESQAEMVCRFRPEGAILFANSSYARSLGTTPEALIGRSFWDYVPPAEHPRVREMLSRLTPQSPVARIENRFETADGTRWTLWTNRALAFDAAGRLVEAQSTGVDMTERRRAEEALKDAEASLREADRRKDEFLATLSHELRNPLAPLRNALELLRLAGPEDTRSKPLHEMMARQLNHLVRLVDDLLEISRISRGAFQLRRERVLLETVVQSAVETSEPLVREARHALEIALPQAPVWLEGDPVRLSQILANLLNNAARYTPPGGRIALRAAVTRENVEIAVEDNGKGIAATDLAELFVMFRRSADSRRRNDGGLGVGLALSRRLAEMHGGTVLAHSEGPGKGSRFVVRLPLAPFTACERGLAQAPSCSSTSAP